MRTFSIAFGVLLTVTGCDFNSCYLELREMGHIDDWACQTPDVAQSLMSLTRTENGSSDPSVNGVNKLRFEFREIQPGAFPLVAIRTEAQGLTESDNWRYCEYTDRKINGEKRRVFNCQGRNGYPGDDFDRLILQNEVCAAQTEYEVKKCGYCDELTLRSY